MILVIGAGFIGSAIGRDLSKDFDVGVMDRSSEALDKIDFAKKFNGSISDNLEVIKNAEIIVSALPGKVAYDEVRELMKMGKKVVDISFMPEDPLTLDEIAKESGSLLIPDAGYAPGLTNILAGYLHKKGKYKRIEIYCGGLPEEKIPPLDYVVTWSIEGLIDEYIRPARIIENQEVVSVDPLESIETHDIQGLGKMESFYSDGLRTLIETMKDTDMFERTFRYPGHLEKMKFLREMGYMSEEDIEGCIPRKLTEKLFEKLKIPAKDLSILIVRGVGQENEEFSHIDYFDESSNLTSMARMTGFTAAVITRAVAKGLINGKGVIPPEHIGKNDAAFSFVLDELEKRGIKVRK